MPLAVSHAFVQTLPDQTTDVAAGKIVGSNWNAAHVVTGSIDPKPQVNDGTVSSGTVTLSVTPAGSDHILTVAGVISIAFSNWAVTGTYAEIQIQLVNGGTNVTWPTINWLIGDGTTSTVFSNMGVTLSASGTNWILVWSTDGGVTLYGRAA